MATNKKTKAVQFDKNSNLKPDSDSNVDEKGNKW